MNPGRCANCEMSLGFHPHGGCSGYVGQDAGTNKSPIVKEMARKLGIGVLSFHPSCVICQNEGMHNTNDRPHVMEGQE